MYSMPLKKALTYISVFLGIVALSFSTLKVVGLLLVIIIGTYLLPLKLNFFYKLALSFSIFLATNTLLSALFWLFKIHVDISIFLFIYSLLLILVVFLSKPKTPSIPINTREVLSVVFGFIISLIAFLILMSPILGNRDSAFRVFTYSSDNISNIELLKAEEGVHGYFYEPYSNSGKIIEQGLSGYPQGFHINAYLLKQSIEPVIKLDNNYRTILLLYGISSLVLILLAVTFVICVRPKKSIVGILITSTATVYLFLGLFAGLFVLGSQAQVLSMAFLLCMIVFFKEAIEDKNHREIYTHIALVFCTATAFAWLLLLPIAGLVTLYYIYLIYIEKQKIILSKLIRVLAPSLAILLIALVQVYVQKEFGGLNKVQGINEPGFSITPNLYMVLYLVLFAFFAIAIFYKKIKFWLTPLIVSSIFSLFIYFYQIVTVGEPRYYLYKSLYIVILLLSIPLTISISYLLEGVIKTKNLKLISAVFLSAIFLSVFMSNITDPNGYITGRKSGGFSNEISAASMNLINNNPKTGRQILSVGSCNRQYDYINSRLVGVLVKHNNQNRQALTSTMLSQYKENLLIAIKRYQINDTKNLIILSSDYQLQQYLEKNLTNVKFVDLTFGNHIAKTPAQCPNAVIWR